VTALPHPHWCVHCDVAADVPAIGGELHRGAVVILDVPVVYGDQVRFYVQLRQQVSVHVTEPVLAVWRPGDPALLVPLHGVRGVLSAAVALLGRADSDIALDLAEQHAAMRAETATAVRKRGQHAQ
jgi:hypothetical protein